MSNFKYVFPAIQGTQAQQKYYVSMCPLRLIPKLFLFDEDEVVPELRAQRSLNRSRVPEISRYIADNPDDYVFSAITASIDGEVVFESVADKEDYNRMGFLNISMDSRFIINDGQHRRAAIEMALRERPELGDETIAVVFFLDPELERSQQMFADLNRYAVKPSTSLGILYDYRDAAAQLVKKLIAKSVAFRDVVELEKTTLSARSRRLFTLSAIYRATGELLKDLDIKSEQEALALALEFWEELAQHMEEWQRVRDGRTTSGEVRADYLNSHGVILHALARAGSALIQEYPEEWKAKLSGVSKIDWGRSNAELWEGRAMVGGRVSKSYQHVTLTANAIKQHLGLALSPDEQRVENKFCGELQS